MAKKLKDLNKPKKPLTAYFRYLKANREKVKTENPGIKPAQLTKLCGGMWTALTPEERKPFMDEAQGENDVWKVKWEEYKKTPEFAEFQIKKTAQNAEQKKLDKKRKRRMPKDKNAPKKVPTAFFLYSASVREEVKLTMPENERNKVTLITKKIGGMWRGLPEETKTLWKSKGETLKVAYREKLAEYKESAEYATFLAAVAAHKEKLKEEEAQEKEDAKKAALKKRRKPKKPKVVKRQIESDSDSSDSEEAPDVVMEETEEESSESEES